MISPCLILFEDLNPLIVNILMRDSEDPLIYLLHNLAAQVIPWFPRKASRFCSKGDR